MHTITAVTVNPDGGSDNNPVESLMVIDPPHPVAGARIRTIGRKPDRWVVGRQIEIAEIYNDKAYGGMSTWERDGEHWTAVKAEYPRRGNGNGRAPSFAAQPQVQQAAAPQAQAAPTAQGMTMLQARELLTQCLLEARIAVDKASPDRPVTDIVERLGVTLFLGRLHGDISENTEAPALPPAPAPADDEVPF